MPKDCHRNAGQVEDALAAYDKFFAAFTTDNHDQITTFFAPDAQFYGTNSTEVVTSREGIRKYFLGALTGTRGATKATQFDRTALALSDTVVAIAGKWQSERTQEGKMITAGPFAQHGCYAKARRSMADRAVPQLPNP